MARSSEPRKQREKSRSGEGCVAEVMGTDMFTVTPDTAVAAALRLALVKNVKHFLVVDDGSLTGIVCESDLQSVGNGKLVSDCMKSPVLCISPETTLEQAAGIMEENAVGCLPVVTGAFLVGVVTRDGLRNLDIESVTRALERESDACVSCGGTNNVRRDFRSNFIPLCRDCMMATGKSSGN